MPGSTQSVNPGVQVNTFNAVRLSLNNFLIIFVLCMMAILPFLDLRQMCMMALFTSVTLIAIGTYKLLSDIKAYYFVLLGFGVMAFLDIWKYNFFFNPNFKLRDNYDWAAYWTYISFLLFLFFYKFKSFRISIPNIEISRFKVSYVAIPLSVPILLYYITFIEGLNVNSSLHSFFHLISFFPKACAVLLFYMFVRYKKFHYLLWFLVLVGMSFTEGTRRVYITLFLTCFTIVYAYIVERKGKISGKYKVLVLLSFIGIFFYMNFLRSDLDIEGSEEGAVINNTINYMMQLQALDTYDNTAFVLSKFPKKYDYYYGETYFALFVQFMPRTLWQGKPVGLGGPLGLMRVSGKGNFTKEIWIKYGRGISLSPGFVGEAYANFGIPGILIMSILFGLVTKFFDVNVDCMQVASNPIQMANASWYGSFFLLLRGDMVAALYYSMLFYLFLRFWLWVVRR